MGILFCVRRGAIDVDVCKQLKATGIPVLHFVTNLISKRKRTRGKENCEKLQQSPSRSLSGNKDPDYRKETW